MHQDGDDENVHDALLGYPQPLVSCLCSNATIKIFVRFQHGQFFHFFQKISIKNDGEKTYPAIDNHENRG